MSVGVCSPAVIFLAAVCSAQVKDSRWAYTEIPSMYEGNPGGDLVPDVYGHLRSRWNANDSP